MLHKKHSYLLKLFLFISLNILYVNKARCSSGDTTICFFKKTKYYGDLPVKTLAEADYFRLLILTDPDSTVDVQEFYKNGKPKLLGTSNLQSGNARLPSIILKGSWTSYFPNGKKMGMYNAENEGNRYVYFFYPTGKIYTCIKNNLYWECYDKNGELTCKEGNGLWTLYDENFDQIKQQGIVKKGYPDGEWQGNTHRNDSIKYTYTFRNGTLVKRIGYDNNGKAYPFDYIIEWEGYYAYQYGYKAGEENVGGPVAFVKDVRGYLKWPRDEKGKKISIDTMHVVFTIEGDGTLSNISLLGDVDEKVNTAVIAAVKQCRDWHPVRYYGVPLKTIITCALTYTSGYYGGAPPIAIPKTITGNMGQPADMHSYFGSHVDYKRFVPDL